MTDSDEFPSGPIEQAVRADLEHWGLTDSGLGASALDMARALDDPEVKPTPRSMLHAQLRLTLESLAKLAPEEDENDAVDEIARKRRERRGA